MSDTAGVEGTTLAHRVVLLGPAELDVADETPAHAVAVRRVCRDRLDAVEAGVVGTLTEAEVARSLNELESGGLVGASRDDTSPTGKGRPRYDLSPDRGALLDELADDDRVEPLVDAVGE